MGMRITIDLDDNDLKHFRLIMRAARSSLRTHGADQVVRRADQLLDDVRDRTVPGFVRERLDRLDVMIKMLTDHEWRLPQKDSSRVLNVLAYLTEPDDLIPDDIPGIGFLDDAIMIELALRELRHEIEAYEDFCRYRAATPRRGVKARTTDLTREQWLDQRRLQLQERMRRRRDRQNERGADRMLR